MPNPVGTYGPAGDITLKDGFADGTLSLGSVKSLNGNVTLIADNLGGGDASIVAADTVTWMTANDRAMAAGAGLFDVISAPTIVLGGGSQTQNIALVDEIDLTGGTTTTLKLFTSGTAYQGLTRGNASLAVQNFVAVGGNVTFTGTNYVDKLQMKATAGDATFYNENDLKLAQTDSSVTAGASASGTLFISSLGSIDGERQPPMLLHQR